MENDINLESWERIGITPAFMQIKGLNGDEWVPEEYSLYLKEFCGQYLFKAVDNKGQDYMVFEGGEGEHDKYTHYFVKKVSDVTVALWLNLSGLPIINKN